MGADQSSLPANVNVKVKNTFIEVGVSRDTCTRLRRCLSVPSLRGSRDADDNYISSSLQKSRYSKFEANTCDETQADDNEAYEELARPQLCHWKTMDALDSYLPQDENMSGELETNADVLASWTNSEDDVMSSGSMSTRPGGGSQSGQSGTGGTAENGGVNGGRVGALDAQPWYGQPSYRANVYAADAQKWNCAALSSQWDSKNTEMSYGWDAASVNGLILVDVPEAMPVSWGMDMASRDYVSWADVAFDDSSCENDNFTSYAQTKTNTHSSTGRYRWGRGENRACNDSIQGNAYSVWLAHHEHQVKQQPHINDAATWTTRMLRNLPNDYTRQDLVELLDFYRIEYEFIYLPIDWRKKANLGYAFVGLASEAEAERIKMVLDGFGEWKYCSEKKCEVVWGKPDQQSLHGNIERFRNSPVMHPEVPDECKPMLFQSGKRVPFPAPTRHVSLPRGFHRKVACN